MLATSQRSHSQSRCAAQTEMLDLLWIIFATKMETALREIHKTHWIMWILMWICHCDFYLTIGEKRQRERGLRLFGLLYHHNLAHFLTSRHFPKAPSKAQKCQEIWTMTFAQVFFCCITTQYFGALALINLPQWFWNPQLQITSWSHRKIYNNTLLVYFIMDLFVPIEVNRENIKHIFVLSTKEFTCCRWDL